MQSDLDLDVIIHLIWWLSILHKMLWKSRPWIATSSSDMGYFLEFSIMNIWSILDVHTLYSFVATVYAVNKQLNDKERVAAALENPNLLDMVDECLAPSYDWGSFFPSKCNETI